MPRPGTTYGVLEFKQGRLREAVAAYGRAAHLKPYDPDVHYNLGSLLHLLGDPASARREYRTLSALSPELARRLLGVISPNSGE